MANFGSPDFTGLGQQFPGHIFGPRHSSPNITGANSPIPPNIGPIPTVPPPGVAGPHIRLFNPVGMAQFPAVTCIPWGAGVMSVAGQTPITVPPPQAWMGAGTVQPQVQVPVAANQVLAGQQTVQSESMKSPPPDDPKHRSKHKNEHKHAHKHKHGHRHSNKDDRHSNQDHRHSNKDDRHSHQDHRHSKNEDRHGNQDNRHSSKEDRHSHQDHRHSSKDRHFHQDHRHSSKEERHSHQDHRHSSKDDRHSHQDHRHSNKEDRHSNQEHRESGKEDRHSSKDDKHRERKHHREKKRSPRKSHHHEHEEKRKSPDSRHGSDRYIEENESHVSHVRKKRHSPGSRHKHKKERHRAVLIEDGDRKRSERGSHGAVLLEDIDERSDRGTHGAVLLEDIDEISDRGSHHAVLLEDRESEFEEERGVLRSDYDAEDGEIYDDEPLESTYSEDDRQDRWRYEEYGRDRNERLASYRHDKISSRDSRRDDRHSNDFDKRSVDDLRKRTPERYKEDRDLLDRPIRNKDFGHNSREQELSVRYGHSRDGRSFESKGDKNRLGDREFERRRNTKQDDLARPRHDRSFDDGNVRGDESYRHKGHSRRGQFSRNDDYEERWSRHEDNLGFSDSESQYGYEKSRSEKSVCSRGHSGAILREDCDEGAILLEDREPERHRAVLIEDGVEFDDRYEEQRNGGQHSRVLEDRKGSRSGALLLDDREPGYSEVQNNRTNYREQDLKHLEERGNRREQFSDRGNYGRHRNIDNNLNGKNEKRNYDNNKDGRVDKTSDRNHRGLSVTRRAAKSEREESVKGFADDLEKHIQNRPPGRNFVPEVPLETKTGRTGALLIEDRDSSDLKRDKRCGVSRSGALLIEDREDNSSFDRGQRGQNASFTGQGHRGLSRTNSTTSISRQCLERSRSDISRSKRSRSNSLSKQEVRIRQERNSREREEPEPKKRRVWEPGPNDVSATKCIRSGSPVVLGDDPDMDIEPIAAWVRCSPADLYFTKDSKTGNMVTTKRMRDLEERFDHELVQRAAMVRALQEPYERELPKPNWKNRCSGHTHHCGHTDSDGECSSSSSSSSDSESDSEEWWMEEMKFKQQNPYRLHSEIWYNDPNELNYGPLCRCSNKAKTFGIRHSIYPGEEPLPLCDVNSNNLDKLYHYRITVSPAKNFIISLPTVIMFDGHEYLFEGFSIFSHKPIPKWPDCQVIRFNIIYTIHVVEEQVPENFSIQSLDTFTEYLFDEILELVDIDWRGPGGEGHCRRFHVMPRFARPFPENGKELLSMNDVLLYLLKASKPLLEPSELKSMYELDSENWTKYVDSFRHMVVTCPGKRPSSIRIDQLDRTDCDSGDLKMPFIIHHGVRPPQLSYAGDPVYKKKWREYMKFRHLLWSRARISAKEKEKLSELEIELEKIRMKCSMKKEITVAISSEGFLKTGIRADICQHAMLLPVLFEHLRFHECLAVLEKSIGCQFKDRSLLQLAMTHSSYKINYGTNPDHGRNSLSNCGFRQLEFGDHKVVTQHTRKRGLNVLLRIMAKMGHKEEKRSEIPHNERLEFLGDAVVEFVTSTHLYNMFPQASEGELTLYRGSLVNNAHLSVLANNLRLQDFLLYAHGQDLCHDSNLKHAMANCFEALMGALFLDGGIELADRVFSKTCFPEADLLDAWTNTPSHPLIADEPNGDRHWIAQSHVLQKLAAFEEDIGYEFKHIRLLARAFTQRNVGYNNLTYGHNQRLEFLGDTIMQLICSEYLFKHFPDHHEGHLTLLRSSLVNNKTQAMVAAELGMPDFVIKANMTKVDEKQQNYYDLKTKEKADLLEALYGALYVDGGLEPCQILTEVCFFPRLEDFILDQEWNDPKSQLQQCCLTLREMNDDSPDIPVYKVIGKFGPTNQRRYVVAVYFRDKRLAVGTAGSKQQAEMAAAESALKNSEGLFHKNVYPLSKSKVKQLVKKEIRKDPN